ncbi:LuxR C-terminal-related transcriptional regulator [Pararhodospirillum oryzae]|uniref:DNA-binding response regulator n=1 Tax=Pararhodospirillum oryzae TaxID=478448 RepID=A0A512H4H9_9PROT|nr:response regulator transcription factor [Pararhodospirillum oryzae]GEO80347.1 DNA-binding response regulator [Pararhodospirillum oryzae]
MRLLIADDHELFRDGLRLVLGDLAPEVEVVEARSFDEALALVGAEPAGAFDLLLVDLVMPGLPWTEGLARLRALAPDSPIVVLSAGEDGALVREAVHRGAAGFISKAASSKVILGALKLVLSGGLYLPPTLLDDAPAPAGLGHAGSHAQGGPGAPDPALASPLTPRQREVLALIGQGKSNKEIAHALALSEGTVKLHVTAILKALGANNRTGAVIAAQRLGLTG